LCAGGSQNGAVSTHDDVVFGIACRGYEQGFDPDEIQRFRSVEIHLPIGIRRTAGCENGESRLSRA
jgi:hypothetical protein